MAITKFSNSSVLNGFPKYRKLVFPLPEYSGETVSGGNNNYQNQPSLGDFTNGGDNSLNRNSNSGNAWSNLCSNQGSYYGGIQTTSGGGYSIIQYPLNNGNALSAGGYKVNATVYLDLNNQNTSHDGIYLYAVTPTKKFIMQSCNVPNYTRDTQINIAGSFALSTSETVKLEWQTYDGSSAWAMGIRIYGFTVTREI